MKKMMLLASMVAFAALMLAAAPAFAFHEVPACDKENPTPGNPHCEDQDRDHEDDGDDDDDGDDNGNEITSNDRFRFNNVGNLEVSPTFEASQETEQDCDTGEVSQPIDVTGGGDNSIQTVGLNPSANTGCAQTALGVLDFDPILGVQGGDFAFNFDENNVILDDDCDDNGNHNGDDNGDEVNINDRDSFRFGGDRQIIHGGGGDEFDFDDIGSSINMDGGGDTVGGGTIEQAAAASSQQFVPWWWM